ncbi:MAG: hypothetical protein ACHQ17_10005, partial [Polyangia bacterium]
MARVIVATVGQRMFGKKMRAPVVVALILLGGAAPARAAVRLHWRGLITVGARAPAHLDQAVRA